jgi:hypothetical protein
MTYLTEEQVKILLRPIHPNRVLIRDGMSYVEGYDIRAELTRVFGFGRWSSEVLDQALLCEREVKTRGGKDAWYVVYRSRIRLTVQAPDGSPLAAFDGSHVGESTHPVFGEAHGNALTNSETYALRRAAINLGDQFGLSLYNKGSLDPIVRWTLVKPGSETGKANTDDVPKVSAETSADRPAETGNAPGDAGVVILTPEQVRDEALNITTTPERITELLIIAEGDYPDVVLQNGNGDDERLVDQLKHISDERGGRQARPEPKQDAPADSEADWIQGFYERLAGAGPAGIRPLRVEVMTAVSAKLIAHATANELLAALDKRKGELGGSRPNLAAVPANGKAAS